MALIDEVDFGRFDAEEDENLLEYFIEVGAAAEVRSGGKYLVVGRKGSGKTALFRYVSAQMEGVGTVLELDLENYVFVAHKALIEAGVSKQNSYTLSWRFSIACLMYLKVRPQLESRARRQGDRALKAIASGPNRTALHAMASWLKRVKSFSLPSITGLGSLGSLTLNSEGDAFIDTRTIDALDSLEEVLVSESSVRPMSALIDRLDDAWDGTTESLELIAGAVKAARHYSQIFSNADMAPVVVFLRSDLWEEIRFNDKNKFSQDMLRLDWDRESLKQVIDARIAKARPSQELDWFSLFTDSEMQNRQLSQNYIIKRCMGRPRDIVAFAIFAREAAIRAGHEIIGNQDIYEGERQYSRHIVDEMVDELQGHLSSLDAAIRTLKSIGRRSFALSDWMQTAGRHGMDEATATVTLETLFESSILGVLRVGGSTGGSKTVYRYEDRFIQATDTGQLQVHPALTKELSLTDR
ncbi:P-loop ATPase, Sll1717 family [Brachybacterium tyrofermentans]|uniref:P-loop ATPase, Sll1717 family n=1 Tax=Brachybacterium tyrofermentans TaxID=47848 RepID=UPI003FD4EF66